MKKSTLKKGIFTMGVLSAALGLIGCSGNGPAGNAPEAVYEGVWGKEGDNVSWVFDRETGVLTINGTGEMRNGLPPWAKHGNPIEEQIKGIVIEEGVTAIGESNFYGLSSEKFDVSLPSTIKRIEGFAFYGDYGMQQELKLPEQLEYLGESAFEMCSGLTGGLIFPEHMKTIEKGAFNRCSSLDGSLEFPEGLETIGSTAFKDCEKLKGDLRLPDSLTELGGYAYENCSGLQGTLTLSSGLREIPGSAFAGCGFQGDLVIPDGVNRIGHAAFRNNPFNGKLILSAELKEIGSYAFLNTGFTGITMPDGIEMICSYAFSGALHGDITDYHLPAGIRYIGAGAFCDCDGIKGTLAIPEGIDYIAGGAFARCRGLTGIVEYPESLTYGAADAFAGSGIDGVSYQGINRRAEKPELIIADSIEGAAAVNGDGSSSDSGRHEDTAYVWNPVNTAFHGYGEFSDTWFRLGNDQKLWVEREKEDDIYTNEVLGGIPFAIDLENRTVVCKTEFVYRGYTFREFVFDYGYSDPDGYGRCKVLIAAARDKEGKDVWLIFGNTEVSEESCWRTNRDARNYLENRGQ